MSVDETLMCSFQILKPADKKLKFAPGQAPTPPLFAGGRGGGTAGSAAGSGTGRPLTPPRPLNAASSNSNHNNNNGSGGGGGGKRKSCGNHKGVEVGVLGGGACPPRRIDTPYKNRSGRALVPVAGDKRLHHAFGRPAPPAAPAQGHCRGRARPGHPPARLLAARRAPFLQRFQKFPPRPAQQSATPVPTPAHSPTPARQPSSSTLQRRARWRVRADRCRTDRRTDLGGNQT
eukprot:ctg_360.g239